MEDEVAIQEISTQDQQDVGNKHSDTGNPMHANALPTDILAAEASLHEDYVESDVFAWANNLVQYKDELQIEVYWINKNYVVYKTDMSSELSKQLEPIFIDEMLEYVLEGAGLGLVVRNFEDAEAEENVLQRTQIWNVQKAQEVLAWVRTQAHEIEMFREEEHDFKRIKGVMAKITHKDVKEPFYIWKVLPQSQIMKGKTGWMVRGSKFVPFDADAAVRVPSDPQLLLLGQDLYVFNQTKLKQLFGYDAKEAAIAKHKVEEIEENFTLSFDEGLDMQTLALGKKSIVKKLQKIDATRVTQDDLMNHAEELGIDLMQDTNGAIIIMDDKDLSKFVNLLNDDYMESPLTGERYEIIRKKPIKQTEEDLIKEALQL
ncbi:MAG TPA: Kiwa anti-phage protein KwaB-like domain-containing protein [Candidatus Saccharimonadales bacterium]|nr:Kiwa anti-phage protein KwaB-like domain-containing protein [Candidatus Saccharimonadales bacterium]